MAIADIAKRTTRRLVAVTMILATAAATFVPSSAKALSPGAAVGLGVGAFALGTALGAAANPYYYGGYYGYPAYGYPTYGPPPYGYYGYTPSYRYCSPYSGCYY
jgi:hypothetical protein